LSPLYRGLAVGPDGALWFTDSNNQVIRRLTTSGAATNFPVEEPMGPPDQLVLANGALWFSSLVNPTVSRLTPQGTQAAYPLALTQLGPFIAGPKGTLWFTDRSQPFVGFLAPGGMIQEFSLPPLQTGCLALATGPDDAIWCSQGKRLARITEAGELSFTELPTGMEAGDLVAGPDGNLWFLDVYHARVGRLLIGRQG
jgi:virginiamycin B lyase